MKKNEISARELLEKIYNSFKKDFNGRELKLPEEVMCEIANDSDGHRTRVGYMAYEKALILKVNKKEWAVVFGTACGAYPAEPYNCDIAAVKICAENKSNKLLAKEIHRTLERTSYFSHSLVFAMADGQLYTRHKEISVIVKQKINGFISNPLKIDSDFVATSTLSPVVQSAVKYKPEFVEFLFETLRDELFK